jgi:osmoprotectant transport system substrate-binding protein
MLAVGAALGLIAAACGSDSEDTSSGASDSNAVFAQLDLADVNVTVGSKDFTEQLVLGEMLVLSYSAAGANVTNRVDLGGTEVNRTALLSGEINVYPEYNGTGWTVHLGNEDPSDDPDTLTANVRQQDLADNAIRWVGQSPFNNTYGFASRPDLLDNGQPFTMQSMADYLADNPDALVCMESEFPDRPDGLILFEQATDFTIPASQQQILDTGIIYTETAAGNCDFGEVFTTDGRIAGLDLNLVDDPGIMILYNVSITMTDNLYSQAPEAFETIANDLLAGLDNETMTELNFQVDIEGRSATDVARAYLVDKGLIPG